MRLFLIAAVVLVVLALIAAASTTALCLGSPWNVWICGALLAYFADLLVGDRVAGYVDTRRGPPAQ